MALGAGLSPPCSRLGLQQVSLLVEVARWSPPSTRRISWSLSLMVTVNLKVVGLLPNMRAHSWHPASLRALVGIGASPVALARPEATQRCCRDTLG